MCRGVRCSVCGAEVCECRPFAVCGLRILEVWGWRILEVWGWRPLPHKRDGIAEVDVEKRRQVPVSAWTAWGEVAQDHQPLPCSRPSRSFTGCRFRPSAASMLPHVATACRMLQQLAGKLARIPSLLACAQEQERASTRERERQTEGRRKERCFEGAVSRARSFQSSPCSGKCKERRHGEGVQEQLTRDYTPTNPHILKPKPSILNA